MTTNYIGKPTNRVDGYAKVTGGAKYAGEHNVPGLTYGVVVSSDIARGRISRIDASEALKLNGVLEVFTHENRPSLPWFDRNYQDQDQPPGSPFRPLYDNEIQFSQQPIALVVAETFELARYAASLVKVQYVREPHGTDLRAIQGQAYAPSKGKPSWKKPRPRGNAAQGMEQSIFKIEGRYDHAAEHHNPLEMHASTVVYEPSGKLTVYDKTQGVPNSQKYISRIFGLSKAQATVHAPFIGGAFGSGLRPQYQLFLAVMAALQLKRSVRVTLTRQQMFSFGHRPATIQRFELGADAEGKLQAVVHEAIQETSQFEDYTENVVNWSGTVYQCDNVEPTYKLVKLDTYTPLDMRAPGGATAMAAYEVAIDELAYAAGIDPLEFRLINYTERDPMQDLPYSSKELRACYRQAAERFGWSNRRPEPRSMRDGNELIGWGMATGIWEAEQKPAMAKAVLTADGKLTVSSATEDIGTGTYTIMTQIAAETLGLPLENVTFELGDSSMPEAPLQGGSWTAATVGSAVKSACLEVQKRLFEYAGSMPDSPLAKADADGVVFADGRIHLKHYPTIGVTIQDVLRHSGVDRIEEEVTTLPDMLRQKKYARFTHSAVFVEVKVDEDLGTVHVTRVVTAVAGGRILNPKTARSQVLGGVVWGIGMALEEESVLDHQFGRFINHDLAEYHVAVNLDVPPIDVIFVEENDTVVNPLGVKGLGEIGVVGTPAAIANAVFHATGKRLRDLPITLDKVM
ncbi:xanthine dehydrogenase family protein molybdopterin-binding subunit [Larkinella soli]|uniref:xanthine dehydrogenase family protein molybdopterin-binding subunit n=1 Tax=Larkinella soli TaxID=1770527 RepID=UPI000FFBEC40|nr:xanthine dehydrogenase family protein molybdopterin-binding subunit [Larkinella soli]